MSNARKIAFINGKGGCGKTTSIFHVAGVLSQLGEKILVIDLDKQRNITDCLLYNSENPKKTVFDFIRGTASADEATQKALFQSRGNANAKYYGVDCMVSDIRLENEKNIKKADEEKFRKELEDFIDEQGYTWVLVDMPPSNVTLNDICFSYIVNHVIVPFSSDVFSVSGYGDIVNTIDKAREINPSINTIGVYLAKYQANISVDIHIREQLLEYKTFIDIQIPYAADARESIMFGRPISYYKTSSPTKTAYENLVNEMKKRIDKFI